MKIIAVNGSPRKNGNTAAMLEHALKGAESKGAETETVHLYSLKYTGCVSCLSCKLKNTPNRARCAINDDLSPVLGKLLMADAIVFGSPLYFGDLTSGMRALIERLMYPLLKYDKNYSSIFGRKIKTGLVVTMNVKEPDMPARGYPSTFNTITGYMGRMLGSCEYITANDTFLFPDYSKYDSEAFDPAEKAEQREKVFPLECEKAFQLGTRLVSEGV